MTLRVSESLAYEKWQWTPPQAQDEYQKFEAFLGRLRKKGEYIGMTVDKFLAKQQRNNIGGYPRYGLTPLKYGTFTARWPDHECVCNLGTR